jgi:hypothetical protein
MGVSIPPHCDVNARVQVVLREHEHPDTTDARLAAMKAAAITVFDTALRERGTDPAGFELLVHIDELVGPMAFVVELGGQQRRWPLPAFQGWLATS